LPELLDIAMPNVFRSAGLLFAVALLAVTLLGFAGCKNSTPGVPEAQQEMFEEVQRIKGVCSIETETEGVGVYMVDLSNTAADDAFVGKLTAFPELRRLVLDNTKVTDAVVPQIKKLKKLEQLSIGSTKMTVRTEYQEAEEGKKIRIDTPVPVPLLSQAAVNNLQQTMPELQLEGIETNEQPDMPN
jgi:hypothetical protein